ncbi:hypothetical protein [Thalassobacillus pellis]|uniref:hypothetical protein n=1 Tax=Thalassobacillus pellis TaxID=748008 RepID=UPI00195F9176|nr:hypothetical protein [Thalassobacillus pellis]MBM7552167.1 hypothetical protein [Thalassobacillus pellis]
MGKSVYVVLSLFLTVLVAGCNQEPTIEWHETKEAAIETGLKQEGEELESILSIENFDGETLVFYDHTGSIGVAYIAKSEKGYGWNRSQPYIDFEKSGELAYSTSSFEMETETGEVFSILIGETFDSSIQKMKFSGNGAVKELEVSEENGYFYAVHKMPSDAVDVSPIVY